MKILRRQAYPSTGFQLCQGYDGQAGRTALGMRSVFCGMSILMFLLCSQVMRAAIGCMDDSYHLQKLNDTKARHYVSCNCPCNQYKILSHDSKCLVCFHYHAPKQWMVVRGDKEIMTTEQYVGASQTEHQPIPQASQKALSQMVQQYKKTRAYREQSIRAR